MDHTNVLPVRNSTGSDLVVLIEPDGREVVLGPGDQIKVVVYGPGRPPSIELEWMPMGVVVQLGDDGETCAVFKNGQLLE